MCRRQANPGENRGSLAIEIHLDPRMLQGAELADVADHLIAQSTTPIACPNSIRNQPVAEPGLQSNAAAGIAGRVDQLDSPATPRDRVPVPGRILAVNRMQRE